MELHETCLVWTDDTRLARPELLEEVEGDIVEGRLVIKVETRSTHTRNDHVVAALTASLVAVVVSQFTRGNAVARAIGNWWRCAL